MSESEQAIRILAQETRFSRRLLGKSFIEFTELSRAKHVSARCVQSMNNVGYVFFCYASDSTLEERKSELVARCFASILRFSECSVIIGIGVNIPGDNPKNGYSSELVLIRPREDKWTEEDIREAEYCRDEFGFFKNPQEKRVHEDEYPELD
jgi:hypothetical protein